MGGASRGRVAKKQRSTKTPPRTSVPNSASASGSIDQQNSSSRRTQPARSMRRGSRRPSRSAPAEHHYPNLSAIDDLFNKFKEPDGKFIRLLIQSILFHHGLLEF